MNNFKGKSFLDFPNIYNKEINSNTEIDEEKINLRDKDLRGASFEEMTIRDLDLSGSLLQGASFKNATLINVKIDSTETGITSKAARALRTLSYFLALVAGIIAAYSLDYFFLLLDQSLSNTQDSVPKLALTTFFLAMLAISVLWSIRKGMGTYFSGFLLLNVFLSFLVQAFTASNDVAATSLIALSCFVGGFSSVITQSQAVYLSKELSSISKAKNKVDRLRITAVMGAVMGAYLASSFFIISTISALILICFGHNLGFRAWKEKQGLAKEIRKDFFEFSRENIFSGKEKNELLKKDKSVIIQNLLKTIERVKKEERKRRLVKERYAAVRVIFDTVLNTLKTNFLGSILQDVTFLNTDLNKTYFLPNEIIILSNQENGTDCQPDDVFEVEESGSSETEDSKFNIILSHLYILYILSTSARNGSVVNIIGSSFGGGIATDGGIQAGGNHTEG